ncbi:MAG TPA: DUF4097 family beta strand repeat-containing protein [Actinomycetota bacterium]|nr:DUF4097 family beta strand repeat-containing protein [Actinomycetota bacterium]
MNQTFQTKESLDLSVSVPAGSLDITAVPDATETTVEVERLDRAIDPAEVECRLNHDGTSLEVKVGRKRFREGRYRVVITTREGANLDIATGAADVRAEGSFGSCKYRSGSGDLQIDELRGSASMKTGSGDVRLANALRDLDIDVASGSVRVGTAHRRASIHVVSGSVDVDVAGADLTGRTVSGDVRIGQVSHGAVRLNSVSGDLDVGILVGSRSFLDLSSVSGQTRSDLDVSSSPQAESAPDLEIRAKTVSGDITIRRAAAEDAA